MSTFLLEMDIRQLQLKLKLLEDLDDYLLWQLAEKLGLVGKFDILLFDNITNAIEAQDQARAENWAMHNV